MRKPRKPGPSQPCAPECTPRAPHHGHAPAGRPHLPATADDQVAAAVLLHRLAALGAALGVGAQPGRGLATVADAALPVGQPAARSASLCSHVPFVSIIAAYSAAPDDVLAGEARRRGRRPCPRGCRMWGDARTASALRRQGMGACTPHGSGCVWWRSWLSHFACGRRVRGLSAVEAELLAAGALDLHRGAQAAGELSERWVETSARFSKKGRVEKGWVAAPGDVTASR